VNNVALYVYKNVQIAENIVMAYGSMYVYLVIMHTVATNRTKSLQGMEYDISFEN
jgi:hypothetical protein